MKKKTEENCGLESSQCGNTSNENKVVSNQAHWEKTYKQKADNKLGWYQNSADQSMKLILQCDISKSELVADIGSGSSVLIDNLLENGYTNLVATDISKSALSITENRIPQKDFLKVKFIVADLLNPKNHGELKNISIWHDRAVFHFLTKETDRKKYFELLDRSVAKGKFVIIATFNLQGVDKCSGLPIEKYDEVKLKTFLGKNYELLDYFNYNYKTPSGSVRPYIYTLFRKRNG